MDAKEAIKTLEKLKENLSEEYPCSDNNSLSDEDINAFNISIETLKALEKVETLETENTILKRKEVPKVPENMFIEQDLSAGYIVKRDIRGFCPTCSSGLLLYNGVHRYCPFCSQKLDWPSDKE